jgi:hypothetical protein
MSDMVDLELEDDHVVVLGNILIDISLDAFV